MYYKYQTYIQLKKKKLMRLQQQLALLLDDVYKY